jgi:Tfp pilus assembly PilM family ATPase
MAQKALVLDIGTYSVKRVVTRVPLIGFAVSGAGETRLTTALEPKTRRGEQVKVVKEMLPGKRLTGDAITVTMPAERTLNRFVEMPFSDRTKLDSILAFEMENHVPLSADEFLHDYIIMDKRKDGATLFVSVIPHKDVEEYRDAFATFNIDPRILIHQAVANARLASQISEPPSGRAAFVDVGHRKTVVSIVENGRFTGTRVIMHGGYDLTRALAETLSLNAEEAEQEKHRAHLFPAGEGLALGRVQETADCLLAGLSPLVRDLRQTFKALGQVDEIYLFGGGANLGGFDKFMSETLGRPTILLFPSMLKISTPAELDQLQFVGPIAAGFASVKGADSQRINFRQGSFAFEGDFRFVRGRLIYLSFLLVGLLASFITPQVMRYQAVLEKEEQLSAELSALSLKILGEEYDDADEVLGMLAEMPSAEVWTVFPDLTAHEVFWEIADIIAKIDGQSTGEQPAFPTLETSAPEDGGIKGPTGAAPVALEGSAPPPDAVPFVPVEPEVPVHHLEMNNVRIDGASRTAIGEGSVEFTGNASSVATMEMFLSAVDKHSCFHSVQRTKQEMLKATAGKEGWWRFTLEFTVSCPKKAAKELARERKAASKEQEKSGKTEADKLDVPIGLPETAPLPPGGLPVGPTVLPLSPEFGPKAPADSVPATDPGTDKDTLPTKDDRADPARERRTKARILKDSKAGHTDVKTSIREAGRDALIEKRAERARPGKDTGGSRSLSRRSSTINGSAASGRPLVPPIPHERLMRPGIRRE